MRESKLPYQPDQPEKHWELTPEAKEVFALFQRAKQTQDEKEQLALFKDFHTKLVRLLTPSQETPLIKVSGERIKKVVLGLDPFNYIALGGGTGGQRIFLEKWVTIYNDRDKAERLGKGAEREIYTENEITLKSADGKPRWMKYPKPSGGDWHFGERYWNKYIEVFGDEIVDLEQEVESKTKSAG